MKPGLRTRTALEMLVEGRFRHLSLVKSGELAMRITFDLQARVFVFTERWRLRHLHTPKGAVRINVSEILFEIRARFFVPNSVT